MKSKRISGFVHQPYDSIEERLNQRLIYEIKHTPQTMRNDQIFVLLLVVLMPMSGCFGGAVGDAEGAENESSTIVNNYYNNTTLVQPETTPLYHQFSNGTIVISTNPNEVVEVISLDAVRPSGSFSSLLLGPYYSESWTSTWDAFVNINCTMIDDNTTIDLGDSGLNYGGFATSDTLPSDGGMCIYTIQNQWDYGQQDGAPEGIWPLNGMISMTYHIHSTI